MTRSQRMRPIFSLVSVLTLFPLAAFAQPADAPPPMEFVLEIDGKKLEVELDRPFTAELGGKPVAMKLRAGPTRHFVRGGTSFDYPRHFSYQADTESPSITIWTLDGDDVVLMLQEYHVDAPPEALTKMIVDQLVKSYGPETTTQKKLKRRFGKLKLEGVRLDARVTGQHLRQEIFGLPGEPASLLILQDAPTEDGGDSPEFENLLRLLGETFSRGGGKAGRTPRNR